MRALIIFGVALLACVAFCEEYRGKSSPQLRASEDIPSSIESPLQALRGQRGTDIGKLIEDATKAKEGADATVSALKDKLTG